MAKSVEEIMADVLELSPMDQALLAWRLCAAPGEAPVQDELDALWAAEAKRRMDEIDNGTVKALNGEAAFADLRRQLNEGL